MPEYTVALHLPKHFSEPVGITYVEADGTVQRSGVS